MLQPGETIDTQPAIEVVPSRVQRHARARPLGIRWPRGPAGWRPTLRRHRRALLVAVGVVVLSGVALVGFRLSRTATLPNLKLDGTPLGSLEEPALRAAVERIAAERAARSITVTREATALSPATSLAAASSDTGYRVDVDATVEAILHRGRQGNPLAALVDHVRATFGAVSVDPIDGFAEARLDAWVVATSAALSVPPREGALTFEGTVITEVDPAAGAKVDLEELESGVRSVAGDPGAGPVELAVQPVAARTTPEDVDAILSEAQRALSGPVRLRRGTETVRFSPEQIGEALATEPVTEGDDVRLRLVGDPSGVVISRQDLRRLQTEPVDATFKIVGDSVRVVPSKPGFVFDAQRAADQLLIAALSDDRVAKLKGGRVEPDLTTEEARDLGITEEVSTFTTYHACCEPRVTNIHRMADLLDGTVVKPGEILSLNDVVGQRTEENGFVKAPAIREGKFVEEVGGGISQFATTMFNAIFFGSHELLEYKAHSYYFDRYPVGREATVSWPSPDLRFRNDSDAGILIDTSYDDTSITVTFWSSTEVAIEAVTGEPYRYRDPPVECEENPKLAKGKVVVVQEGDVGFDVVVERVFTYPGGRTETEEFFTRYRAQPTIEERRSCD